MFIPHTDSDRDAMLQAIGVGSLDELFANVPVAYRFPALELPPALTEMEVRTELQGIADVNDSAADLACFLGAGAYKHYTPAAVDMLLRRGEFYTAYTPYQPEVSQGTLQAIFEYQSLVAALTGMDVSNASHYDGATAVAEAVNMAYANFRGKRTKVILSATLHPQICQVVNTYTAGTSIEVMCGGDPLLPPGADGLDTNTALLVLPYPDFLGRVYDYTELVQAAHAVGALVCVAAYPIALGMFKSPGAMGADIVTAEGQSLGIPLSYGGPYLGIFATRQEYVRKMAGRLVGETVDTRSGERAFVLTLTAREQHIRRDKATSNICTNQGLIALASAIYMSLLGKHGLRQVAELCYHKAHDAAARIARIPGFSLISSAPFFNEFAVRCPHPVTEINAKLLEYGVLGGYDLQPEFGIENGMLLACTEMNGKEEIDALVAALEEVSHG
ncbi:MAG: aminomethyl-transferring glycine dehydrogenase subunit GcvPA [Chloroflexota bacterium]